MALLRLEVNLHFDASKCWCCSRSLQAFTVAFEAVRLGYHCTYSSVNERMIWMYADSWEGYSLGATPAKAPSSEVL